MLLHALPCALTGCPAEDRQAFSLIKNGHSYILIWQKYDCSPCSFYKPDCLVLFYLPVQEDGVSGTVVSSQQISCSVYQLLSLASVVSHLYKPISSRILFHHNHYCFINLPRAPAEALVTLSIRKLAKLESCFYLLRFCWKKPTSKLLSSQITQCFLQSPDI